MTPQEKIEFTKQNLIDTMNFKEPAKVPVMFDGGGWAYSYAGVTYEQVHDDPEACAAAYCKIYDDIPVDADQNSGCGVFPAGVFRALDSTRYYFNAGGVAHDQASEKYCGPEIYDEFLTTDPMVLAERQIRRNIPAFTLPREQAYAKLKDAYHKQRTYDQASQLIIDKLTNEKGIYQMQADMFPYYMSEFSTFFDTYRGIRNALADLRRYPDKVRAACEALWQANQFLYELDMEAMKEPLPMGHTMFHPECFLSDKWFDELYFQHFMQAIGPAMEAGKKMFLYGEGAFMRHLHRFNETPKGAVAILLDQDDPFEAKKIVGDNCTLICGITVSLLCTGTKQQCVDYVKRAFDELAPGGGFIFSTNQTLISAQDAKVENLIAVYEEADRLSRK